MLANKHEDIHDKNVDLIRKMLAGSDEGVRPYAVYLGNWMADMSQIYDPGVASVLLSSISDAALVFEPLVNLVDTAADTLLEADKRVKAVLPQLTARPSGRQWFSPRRVMAWVGKRGIREAYGDFHEFTADLDAQRRRLRQGLDRLKALNLKPTAMRETMDLLYTVVMFNCLCKFGMDPYERDKSIAPSEVLRLFDAHFGSYKPYQHLDRHLDAAAVAGLGAEEIERNYPCYVAWKAEPSAHGMKDYLRDGVLIAAGHLNSLSLAKPAALTNDDLVKLGFSLHAIEDFFAHSNFMERLIVANSNGKDRWTKEFGEIELPKLVTSNIALEKIDYGERRQPYIRYAELEQSRAGPLEPHLITGYFIKDDVKHSLYNLVADRILGLFEEQMEDGASPEVFDVLEQVFVDAPIEEIDRMADADANLAGLVKSRHIWVKDADIRRLLKRSFPEAPAAMVVVLGKMVNAYITLLMAVSIANDMRKTQETIKAIVEVVQTIIALVRLALSTKAKVAAFLELILPVLEKLGLVLFKESLMQLAAWKTDLLLVDLKREMLEKPAVASHSAIAKDDRLGKSGLYNKVQTFAVEVDALVLRNLVADPAANPPEPDSDQAKPVQWDETLLALLTDPFNIYGPPEAAPVGVRIVDNLEVAAANLDSVVRRGFAASGATDINAYMNALLSLNPTIARAGGRFVYRRGPDVQEVMVPLADPRLACGWATRVPVTIVSDWRVDLYFRDQFDPLDLAEERAEPALQGHLQRGSAASLKRALAEASAIREKNFREFEEITYKLFPAAKQAGVTWGYCGQ